ncbi:hypothetical protein I6H96_21345 [Brucella anthropi]|uniref:hypothetical protein n=1 Tax=Brucella anthropi TaxID=529 RepID=UPI000311B623|nr:hypothetical protein [Brucella anthropi]NKC49083.1 hypothetical protein [Brucella anthropi ATCC 49188]QQC27277.1 hypothetical protein I6H96_21345 [Brucella anthropi]SUB43721.1 Uncharacterised protein [Brucella anthropi]
MTTTTTEHHAAEVVGHLVDVNDLVEAISSLSACIAADPGISRASQNAAASIVALCQRIDIALVKLCELEETQQ